MKLLGLILAVFCLIQNAYSQDLLEERIRRISPRKKSIFLSRGIFHNGGPKVKSILGAVRHSYSKRQGFERVVFDFKTKKIPRVYGHIAGKGRKLYLDLFDTRMKSSIASFGNSKYVDAINFYPISDDSLSVELNFKEGVNVDMFYLENPGRFVIDIKG
ncbi:MAG: hypothetical protein HN509_07725 [Halobacteriovoraceae bacterium]|nr:hypothetical protein [Halobacteriovoraceae bacterium]MBT5094415.1 hypothetical protein [Halobacteriovoraceae bacterium]